MLKNEKGEFSLISLLAVIFGSILIVSAAVLNSTNDTNPELLNETWITPLANDSINLNEPLGNGTLIDEIANQTLNITITIDSITIENQSLANSTINETLPKKEEKNITEIIEKNKHKLNDETKEYFKSRKDKKEFKDFIVKFRNSIDEDKLANTTLENKIDKFKIAKVKGKVEDIEELIEDDEIEFLELEQQVEILDENIPFNIQKTKADSVWNLSKGFGVKVAVLDTGIGPHDDLAIAGGVSFVDNNYFDNNGHGTSVAGVIAALLNNKGLVGVSPDVSLYSVKIMQSSTGELSNAIAGIEWAIDNNMSIVTMSFGMETYSQIFKDVLQYAYNHNILLIAASGNNWQDNILYPAKYDTVIAVGATSENDNLAYFSSYGFEQELVAPGVDINSTSLGNSYSVSSGTSLAAPHVAGVAALIKSFNQSLTNEQIRAKLRNDALDLGTAGKDDLLGYGLVQINLQANNFIFINESYFYEVFNISKINLTTYNFESIFWTEGYGSIDKLEFNPGYYFINITYNNNISKGRIYSINENGSIFILSNTIGYSDNLSYDGGTSTDGIAWINGNLAVRRTDGPAQVDVECFDFGNVFTFSYDFCYAINTQERNDCESDFSARIDCDLGICDSTNQVGQDHSVINTELVNSSQMVGEFFWQCGGGSGQNSGTTNTPTYYVVDRKRARCINSSDYLIEGYYGNGNWVQIGNQQNCGTGNCTDSINYTNPSTNINPCIAQNTCTGTIQAIIEDRNGNPMQGLLVSRDSVSNKTTNSVGVAEYSLSKTCFEDMEFKVYCTNSSSATLCGTQTAKLDVVNDYEGLLFDCSICSGTPDMQIAVNDVKTNKEDDLITVNISLASSFSASNVNIIFKVQDDSGLIIREANQSFNINSGESFKSITQSVTLNGNDEFVHVYVDAKQTVSESNEKNNYALVPLFQPEITAYLNITTGYPLVDQEIKDYLKLFIIEKPQSQAKVTIAVGLPKKNQIINSKNSFTRTNYKWWFDDSVKFNGVPLGIYPFNGLVGGFKDDYNYIFVAGNDIDGLLAAVKRLASARSLFLSNFDLHRVKVIDNNDIAGISVADLLRNPSNYPYYNQRSSATFANVVERILNDNNFEIAIRTVKSYNDNTTLRLKNINTDFSANFTDAVVGNNRPVVLARGLWNNLLSWDGFGRRLAFDEDNARNTWLIEITGGAGQDCPTCPNYNYNDLVDYYWPALITGVQNYTGQKTLDYVGFSNGCRVGLDAVKNWSSGKSNAGYVFDSTTGTYISSNLGSNAVNTFIGLGCPGAFNGTSLFADCGIEHGIQILDNFENDGVNHVTLREYSPRLIERSGRFSSCGLLGTFMQRGGEGPISTNLGRFYIDIAQSIQDKQPGSLNVSKFFIIYGTNGYGFDNDNDYVVTSNDAQSIFSNVVSNDKNITHFHLRHVDLVDNGQVQGDIMSNLR